MHYCHNRKEWGTERVKQCDENVQWQHTVCSLSVTGSVGAFCQCWWTRPQHGSRRPGNVPPTTGRESELCLNIAAQLRYHQLTTKYPHCVRRKMDPNTNHCKSTKARRFVWNFRCGNFEINQQEFFSDRAVNLLVKRFPFLLCSSVFTTWAPMLTQYQLS